MIINKTLKYECEVIDNSETYIIPNFLQDPDGIVRYILNNNYIIWKENIVPTHNKEYFIDRRHTFSNSNIGKILSNFAKNSIVCDNLIKTNYFRLFQNDFNNYKSNYWCPHYDQGYTAIIYLNKDYDGDGTNLYQPHTPYTQQQINKFEHYYPWESRTKFDIIKTFKATYNTCVLFNGKKFLHGMAINDDYFFFHDRLNLVKFFYT